MFTKSESEFLKDKELNGVVPNCSIDYGTYQFTVIGTKKNNKITEIGLDDETVGLDEYAQHLYIFEWQQLERVLLDIPDCSFEVKGFVVRRENNIGSMAIISVLTK
ncbi:hypothetical protein HW132_33520 [Brasilonema sp. CT11]|nr:hypothetical protein [Brasilonema sp. CT11]